MIEASALIRYKQLQTLGNGALRRWGVMATIICLMVATLLGLQAADASALSYVTNSGSASVSVIDTATHSVLTTISVGPTPEQIAVTPNGAFAYVANSGSNTVSVIATATNTVTTTIPVGSNPAGIAITPNGAFAYVANFVSDNVSVIATATNTVTTTIPVGQRPDFLAASPDGLSVYVPNQGSNTVSVIATATNSVVGSPIVVGTAPTGVAFNSANVSGVPTLSDGALSLFLAAMAAALALRISGRRILIRHRRRPPTVR
ncbi:MAG: hypothetical protein C3F12_11875 [Candidatus Methylomirabilota bacterium]|nr:MAG: hypothetical protein C3F12_11875 [candidate division NC10 bacterium]